VSAVPQALRSPLVGPKILLMGEGGNGKTHAIRTLSEAGIHPYVIALEPGFEVLGDVPKEKLGWRYIPRPAGEWSKLMEDARRINTLNYASLSSVGDPNRSSYTRFVDILSSLQKFKDDRTGEDLGPVDQWGTGRAIVIDHLSELCRAAIELTVGGKPVMSQPEYMVTQNNIENLLRQLVTVTRCWVVVIAHLDRILDEVGGGTKIMLQSLGKALSPRLPQIFSDVILANREGKKFTWSTAASGVVLKTRNLPIEDNMPPSFGPIVDRWKSRGGLIE
jgi:AAA domain